HAASNASCETAISGTSPASLKPFAALNPTRTPVNDPGPCTTTTAVKSPNRQPQVPITRRTAGTSRSEAVRPGKTSVATTASATVVSASATLPSLPQVSINKKRIIPLPPSPNQPHRQQSPPARLPYSTDAQRNTGARLRPPAPHRWPASRPATAIARTSRPPHPPGSRHGATPRPAWPETSRSPSLPPSPPATQSDSLPPATSPFSPSHAPPSLHDPL